MSKNFEELQNIIKNEKPNICEVSVLKNGVTVWEGFFNGFQSGNAMNVMSVTKSVVSLLIGIALDRGLIQSVEQKVLDFFPDYTLKRGEKTIRDVTLRNMLTMTSPYKYRHEPFTKVYTSPDWTLAALDLLGGKAGISGEFKYSTVGTQILTGILASVSGMKPVDFANQYLFTPIGVAAHHNAQVNSKEEHAEFIFSKEPRDNTWMADPQGVNTGGWGLCLSSSDMAKIGQLCLDEGTFHGKQIVSSAWVRESTRPYIHCGADFGNQSYGYLWWIMGSSSRAYAAIGDGGNVIYINPQKKIVVSITATFKPRVFDRILFIQKEIEPILA